jgi:hypothetical protein
LIEKELAMDDKILLEDDIVDLTDLLEEGSPPKKPQQAEAKRKMVNEPDSFDLGKEISMDYDVSVEEIEHDSTLLMDGPPLDLDKKPPEQTKVKSDVDDLLKEPLLDIEAEIDLAIKDKFEDVGLTSKEEEALLNEGPAEEVPPIIEGKPASPKEEVLAAMEEPARVERVSIPEIEPSPAEEPLSVLQGIPKADIPVDMPTEAILDAVISEFRKEMPALLEGIVRPVVKELLQEIISSTREVIPGIVETVIQEEIEKLKKL